VNLRAAHQERVVIILQGRDGVDHLLHVSLGGHALNHTLALQQQQQQQQELAAAAAAAGAGDGSSSIALCHHKDAGQAMQATAAVPFTFPLLQAECCTLFCMSCLLETTQLCAVLQFMASFNDEVHAQLGFAQQGLPWHP
jgi:hypothetical protein